MQRFRFHPDDRATIAELPQEAQGYIHGWQRGAVTEAEKQDAVEAVRQLRVSHALVAAQARR